VSSRHCDCHRPYFNAAVLSVALAASDCRRRGALQHVHEICAPVNQEASSLIYGELRNTAIDSDPRTQQPRSLAYQPLHVMQQVVTATSDARYPHQQPSRYMTVMWCSSAQLGGSPPCSRNPRSFA